jgi:hypothetical protein
MSDNSEQFYRVARIKTAGAATCNWDDAVWATAKTEEIASFRPESSDHRPRTSVRLAHDGTSIFGIFRVQDRFVRCVRTEYQSEVWKDSCVEIFIKPLPDRGYFNFEFNCGGAFLCCYITNPERAKDGFKEFVRIPKDVASRVEVRSSLNQKIDPEITEPLTWTLGFRIGISVLEHYTGKIGEISGQKWTGNFFKCAEDVSHPHWASWSPVDEFNFHLPRCFGTLRFE